MTRLFRLPSFIVVMAILFAVTSSYGEENEGGWTDFEKNVEETKAIDNDDIAEKVDEPVKVAQGANGKGVVWGKYDRAAGKAKETEEKKEGKVIRSERYVGRQSRSFSLAQDVDETRAEAKHTNGVLQLTLPKKPGSSKKMLSVT